MKILGLIPARGGSKGIPRKNVLDIAGKPLISWTIDAALSSKSLSAVVVSTDDPEISEIALRFGAEIPFLRPSELSTDLTPGIDPVLHALSMLPGFDIVVLLQPTSPLRNGIDIDNCVDLMLQTEANSIVSVTEPKNHPAWTYEIDVQGNIIPVYNSKIINRRQDLQKVYCLNGAVYAAYTEYLIRERSFLGRQTIGYVMPPERSIDVDDMLDFRIAEMLLKDKN
jgi:N-acylneuraminate cytidylyltransferase/CMP-N,N'-diacetyllegionaminic acid synthase